jgi:hypothetical protein
MIRAWRSILMAILVSVLIAPSGMFCAANCSNFDACCAPAAVMADHCCCDRLLAGKASALQGEPAPAAAVNVAPFLDGSTPLVQMRRGAGCISLRARVHSTPPIVLRT